MALKPNDITWHEFSRKLFGGVDPDEVRTFLAEVAANLNRTTGELAHTLAERANIERAMQEAIARGEELAKNLAIAEQALTGAEARLAEVREELATCRQRLAVYEDRDSQAAGMLLNTQKISERMLQDARQQVDQMLQDAREQVEHMLVAAQADGERIMAESRESAMQIQVEADRHVLDLTARVRAMLALHDEFSRNIDAVRTRHDELLEALDKLRADTRQHVLPLLERSQRALGGASKADGDQAPDTGEAGGLRHEEKSLQAVRGADHFPHTDADFPKPKVAQDGPPGGVIVADRASSAPPEGASEPDARAPGKGPAATSGEPYADAELVVSPFASFLEVTKFLTTLSRLAEVRKASIRTFSDRTATFDVRLVGGAGLDVSRIEGYPLDVVERVGSRIVLRRSRAGDAR
jgi:DivIVA domain-containing protein